MDFSLLALTMILNGHRVQGWSNDEDALMFGDLTLAQTVRGGDGLMLAQSTGDLGTEVTIKLLANSRSAQFFMQQHEAIRLGARVRWNGSAYFSDINVRQTFVQGVMLTGPSGQTVGKGSAAARQFVFDFQEIAKDYDSGRFESAPVPG